jgi:hypothetical protein
MAIVQHHLNTGMRYTDIVEGQRARLGDFVIVKVNDPDADLWIIRRGSIDKVGQPTRDFEKERIGIKITATETLDRGYLYYALLHLFNQGHWKGIATGTTNLVSIKTGDVLNIPLG